MNRDIPQEKVSVSSCSLICLGCSMVGDAAKHDVEFSPYKVLNYGSYIRCTWGLPLSFLDLLQEISENSSQRL